MASREDSPLEVCSILMLLSFQASACLIKEDYQSLKTV